MSKSPVFLIKLVEATQIKDGINTSTVFSVFKSGHGRMEFRGDAMWQWGITAFEGDDGGFDDHFRNHGRNINWAEWLFNSLEGMHSCIFFAHLLNDQPDICIHDGHVDFEAVSRLWDLGLMPESQVIELLKED